MGLRALAQLEAAGTAMDPVDCDMAALSSSQAQVRIAQQALTSAAHVVCKLGGRMLLEQASDPVMMPSSLVQALVHGGKQRWAAVVELSMHLPAAIHRSCRVPLYSFLMSTCISVYPAFRCQGCQRASSPSLMITNLMLHAGYRASSVTLRWLGWL
jgi:hypothetical protein